MHFFERLRTFILLIGMVFYFNQGSYGQAREADFNRSPAKKSQKSGFKFDPEKLVVGGNIGASFGTVTYVELAPSIGYMITDHYLAGFSARYIYFEDRTYAPIYTYKTNIFGGGFFNQYFFLENFIAHAEYELLNLNSSINKNQRTNIHSVFLGGGYRSAIGDNSYFSLLLLYNINDSSESPYTNPLLRIGFGIGL